MPRKPGTAAHDIELRSTGQADGQGKKDRPLASPTAVRALQVSRARAANEWDTTELKQLLRDLSPAIHFKHPIYRGQRVLLSGRGAIFALRTRMFGAKDALRATR
jgi:hypothetical protein